MSFTSLGWSWKTHIQQFNKINTIAKSYAEVKLIGIKKSSRFQARKSGQCSPTFGPLPSPLLLPAAWVTRQEMAVSLLSFCSTEIGTWISSCWLKLNPDKSTAMLIGSGKEFEEVTRNATSSAIKKAFPQSGLGGAYIATGTQKSVDKRRSLS